MQSVENEMLKKQIVIWLMVVIFMIVAMVFVGGLTRMTGSGLSMVHWRPVTGILPPLTEEVWEKEFKGYQSSPEYQQVNLGMSLDDFKTIYYWEYSHRVLGRLVGLVFLLPMLYFWVRGGLNSWLRNRLIWAFILGGAQGVLGWYMVKSGLVDVPHVSHFRLAAHLSLALFLICYLLWILWSVAGISRFRGESNLRRPIQCLFIVVLWQIVYGAFTAGLHAGLVYNTFPTMNGLWIPPGLVSFNPEWVNFVSNPVTVQLLHRIGGVLTMLGSLLVCVSVFRSRRGVMLRGWALVLVATVFMQVVLGVSALLLRVPISLGSAHQMGACLVLVVCLFLLYKTSGFDRRAKSA